MKKSSFVAGLLVLGSFCAGAMAACPGPANARLNQSTLPTTLSGQTACAVRGADRWQEFHGAGGQLVDYKMGPNHPVDPSKPVGTWSVIGNGGNTQVRYDYGSGGQSAYSVYSNGGTQYSFCDAGNTELIVTMVPGSNGCGVAGPAATRRR